MKISKINNQKGAISIFAMLAMLFFMVVIVGAYMITSRRAQVQTQSVDYLEKSNVEDANETYNNKFANSSDRIPIYTKEQLWSIGKNFAIEIDGITYVFSDSAIYDLKNDIIIDIDADTESSVFQYDTEKINFNDYKIYFYHKDYKDYYEKTDSSNYDIEIAGQKLKYKDLGYVKEGLILAYDGIRNTKKGHSDASDKWIDLSGNGHDGTLKNGPIWGKDGLRFDGIDDVVTIGEINPDNITIEIIVSNNANNLADGVYIGNLEEGGYGIYKSADNTSNFDIYSGTEYQEIHTDNTIELNKKYYLAGSFNGSKMKFFENNNKKEKEVTGSIGKPKDNTILVLGANPYKDSVFGKLFNGNIYSVRVYNRALSDEEIENNYKIDKLRFSIK